jgi:hypothetical protein
MSDPSHPCYDEQLPPGDFVRVLDVLPGSNNDPLVGKLRVAELGKSSYIALSYVCGNTSLTHSILLSGHILGIYSSTHELLSRFRDANEVVTVWIDCICINQNDAKEKEREVGVMWKIYENAEACHIWLGPGDEDSRAAMEYAKTLNGEAYQAEYSPYLEFGASSGYWDRKSHILDLMNDNNGREYLVNACAKFLGRPWFTRVWCTQEGAVSANPLVFCGDICVPWIQIFALAWLYLPRSTMRWPDWFTSNYGVLETNLMDAVNIQRYRLGRTYVAQKNSFVPTSMLVSVIQSCAWRLKCFDPRDKIYAMRNIATDVKFGDGGGADWAPKPDYTIPWRELYTNFAVAMAERGEKDVLRLSSFSRHSHDSGLHSWVPDWRIYPWTQYLDQPAWAAGSQRPLSAKINRIPKKRARKLRNLLPGCPSSGLRHLSHTMSVPAVMKDAVSFLSGVAPGCNRSKTLFPELIRIDEACLKHIRSLTLGTYFTSEQVEEAYNKTLIANTTDQDQLAIGTYANEGASTWRAWLREGADPSRTPPYHEAIDSMDTFDKKQLCITSEGYFCLVPAETEPTDVVAIVKGIEMPLVLRPIEDCFIFLGNSYIHGMMEFQATNLIDEFSIKVRDGKAFWKPGGDIRRNGLSLPVGEYTRILHTLGERLIELL